MNTTSNSSFWSNPIRIKVTEYHDRIEFVYKEKSTLCYAIYPPPPPQERVFKIVFSCVDGKWNKSERIYGEIITPIGEQFIFND